MKKVVLSVFTGVFFCFASHAELFDANRKSSFIEISNMYGTVLNTNDYVRNIPYYDAFSVRFAHEANGKSWKDFAFNMPNVGVGFYMPVFANNPGLGKPFAIYLFSGKTLAQFTDKLGLATEISVGLSMNWNAFDPIKNPENIYIGSRNNVYAGWKVYLEYFLHDCLDLKLGIHLDHFSNGTTRKPNSGVNMVGIGLSLAYHINPPQKGFELRNTFWTPPEFIRHIEHDLQFIFSSRQLEFPTAITKLPLPYVDKNFIVLGLAYSPLISNGYRFKWGPSFHFTYDESSGTTAWGEQHPVTEKWSEHVALADFSDRLSFGIALRGEINILPVASVFAVVGYNVYNKHHYDKSLFQTIGIKILPKNNFSFAFGVNANDFCNARFLHWSFGFTFGGKKDKTG